MLDGEPGVPGFSAHACVNCDVHVYFRTLSILNIQFVLTKPKSWPLHPITLLESYAKLSKSKNILTILTVKTGINLANPGNLSFISSYNQTKLSYSFHVPPVLATNHQEPI